jgi:hypothetical protein
MSPPSSSSIDQWVVKDADKLKSIVKKVDYDFSKAGYKTLGVVVKVTLTCLPDSLTCSLSVACLL